MNFVPFSKKQNKILKWWDDETTREKYNTIICDGAIRSGKTQTMIISFVMWAMENFSGCNFSVCGKTVQSAERNVITPFMLIPSMRKRYDITYVRTQKLMTVTDGERLNKFYVFGGKDESSYMLIQGITLAGIMFDEAALMPQSFVNQGIARCSVEGARYWFNCNPENPGHWFYKEWILKRDEKKVLYLRFLMTDNPSLSRAKLDEYERMYSGAFHRRYIKGEWVRAEGLVYRLFADDNRRFVTDKFEQPVSILSVGVDFGGSKSATTFAAVGITRNGTVILLDEKYIAYEIDPDALNREYAEFIKTVTNRYGSGTTRADSAEQILIRGLFHTAEKQNLKTQVKNALKLEINERIRLENLLMSQGRLKIMRHCVKTIDAFNNAVYDDKFQTEDVRLDDGTSNIDSLDAFEYAIEPFYKELEKVAF
ncbi:MAG: PBSX family phage terminase large subunit [Oscillospiraceae bacterium]|nr:PBSX family phage terminase large subunit [Oscillospiraceae bacterium]